MFSDDALKIYSAVKNRLIKSRSDFHKRFKTKEDLKTLQCDTEKYSHYLENSGLNLTCVFDDDFPVVKENANNSDRPFLLAYKGDLSLLKDVKNNVAVIGTLYPNEGIITREQMVVSALVKSGADIVSGLASGCDTIAHNACIECNGKTIAILPSTIENVYPSSNESLLKEIVFGGGLVVTEYVTDSQNRYERIKRFIERDTLQAIFSNSVVLIASHRCGEGDSGARHAMQKAFEYAIKRYVLFDEKIDKDNAIFGLNQDLLKNGAQIITTKNISEATK